MSPAARPQAGRQSGIFPGILDTRRTEYGKGAIHESTAARISSRDGARARARGPVRRPGAAGAGAGLSEPPGAHPGRLRSRQRRRSDRPRPRQPSRAGTSASSSSSRTRRGRDPRSRRRRGARAPKDGYTLFLGSSATLTNQLISANPTFDMTKDFAPIALVTEVKVVLVVHPSTGVKSVKELIALAKAKQGSLLYASVGPGIGAAPRRRIVRRPRRGEDDPRALSGQPAGAHRPDRRAHRGDVLARPDRDPAGRGRQDRRARHRCGHARRASRPTYPPWRRPACRTSRPASGSA